MNSKNTDLRIREPKLTKNLVHLQVNLGKIGFNKEGRGPYNC